MPTYSDDLIKSILRSSRYVAMVGASGNENRPSYFAMKYLLDKGFRVRPINPGMAGKKILNQDVYASLKDVPGPIDIVDIFRGAEYAPKIVAEALAEKDRLGFKVVWMQLGVISEEAAAMAEAAGLTVIMDRCPKIEYGRLSGEIGWMGINRKVIDNRKPKLFSKGGSLMIEGRTPLKDGD
jgi:predicted CoA-binding protein